MIKPMLTMVKNSGISVFLFAIYLCCALGFYTPQVYALAYLDSISGTITDIGTKIMKDMQNDEGMTANILEKLNGKTLQAQYGNPQKKEPESAQLYKKILQGSADIIADTAKGQYAAGDYSAKGFIDALTGQLGELTQEYNEWEKKMNDAIEAEEKEKLNKKMAMQKQMVLLQSQRSALDSLIEQESTPEREAQLDALDLAIADMALQIKQNDEKDVMTTSNVKKNKRKMNKLKKKIEKATAELSEDKIQEKMQTELMKLFDIEPNKEEEEIYETAISKLFLHEDETDNPQNVQRVIDERNREYYDAIKNALETVVITRDSITTTNQHSVACTDASTKEADGVFGAMGLRQCVELQNSIAAAGYLEIMLAMMQLQTTSEMINWKNKYRLRDYDKDFTKFNLDDYLLTKEDLLSKLKNQSKDKFKDVLKNKIKGFF